MTTISSVSASVPSQPLVASPDASAQKAPDVKADDDRDTVQPTPQAPLPPGQGTRIDQLV
jgi:hypothetical protein